MDHSLHFSYENPTYYSQESTVQGLDYQSHLVGHCDANSYYTGPFTERGAFDVYEGWYEVPYVPQNCAPPYEEAPVGWAGTLPEHRQDLVYLHAPVPLFGRAPLLRSNACYSDEVRISAREERSVPCFPDRYSQSITPPQSTFPTPSELLVELSNKKKFPEPASPRVHLEHANLTPAIPLPPPCAEYSGVDTMSTPGSPFTALPPGDSDTIQETITPHEKKRYYLECLEHYVIFLHKYCRRINFEPPPLERVPSHRSLDSRSIRALLIHMEKLEEQMKQQILREEQRFLRLRDALQQQEAGIQATHGV